MIVSVLVIGAFTVISGTTSAQEGERVTEIEFGITFDMEDGAIAASEGETHLFMHSVDGPIWQGLPPGVRASLDTWEVFGSYNNWFLNPAHEGYGTVQMEDAVDAGWIDAPEDVKYLANNYEEEWTVNPFAHSDIRFAMQYLDREAIVEDLLLGWGDERYGPMAVSLEVWQERFVEQIEEKYDLSPEGDWARVQQFVEWGMEDIQDHVAAHPGMGEVTGSIEEGWYYNHPEQDDHQIEIIIMARSEDWRQDKGEWTASRLEDLGFDVTVDPTDSASAIPQAFYGDPHPYDDLGYHIYTGGWISTTGVYFTEAAFNQMHMPWYGFMQTYQPEDRWNMDEEMYDQPIGPSERVRDELGIDNHEDVNVSEADLRGMNLFTATGIETEEDYWEMMYDTAQHGFEHSVRVFAITEIALYPYNPDRLIAAIPESINGYDTYFGPRTMRTDDGTLETDILSGVDRPYMDNWNIEEGSADVYGEYQRRLAREYGAWIHPQTGLPMEVNTYWSDNEGLDDERTHPFDLEGSVETDYEYDAEGELDKYIEVPDTATDYVPAIGDDVVQEWLTVPEMIEQGYLDEEDEYAAVEVTLDIHDLHVWHDGTPFDLRDVMTHHANRRELGYEQTEPYNSGTAALLSPGWDTVIGYEWNLEEGTVTVYGDYTFPIDDKVGNYFHIFPWDAHPITYFGWNQLHAGDDYNYATGVEGQEWIHQLSTDHSEDMIAELQSWVEAGDLPTYLDADNMPEHMEDMAYSVEEFGDIVDSLANFVDERGHSYIGLGPYRIDAYDDVDHDMEITTWDGYGYPQAGESANDMFDRLEDLGYYEDIDRDAYLVDDWDEDEDPGDYVFEFGYWSDQFVYEEFRVDIMEVIPDEILLYEEGEEGDVEIFVDAHWAELFPEPAEIAVTEEMLDDYFIILAESERGPAVKELSRDEVDLEPGDGFSEFSGEMNVADIEESGTYSMEFHARADPADPYSITTVDLPILTQPDFDFTINAEEGGTTDPEPGTYTYDALEEVDITAIPDEGYEFVEWEGDVPEIDRFNEEITLIADQDREITAVFAELPEYELTINAEPEEGGTTDPEPGTHTYYEGQEVTVEAIPEEGWFFDEWTGDYESDDAVITFEIMEDMEITANFLDVEPAFFEVEITDYDDEVEEGDTVTVEFTVENTGELEGTQDIVFSVDGDEEDSIEVTLDEGEDYDGEFEWEADDPGDYDLEVASDDTSDSVTVTVVEEEDPTPGFTLALLVLGAVIAVAIYYKKEQ